MKNYLDMAQDVLRRAAEERQAIAKRRRRLFWSVVPAVCALAVLAILLLPKSTGQRRSAQAQAVSHTPLSAALEVLELPAEELAEPAFVALWETPRMTQAELAAAVSANTTVQGSVGAMDTVRVQGADGTVWYLASAAIRVDEVLTGTAPDELQIVCAAAYGGADADPDAVPIPQLAECREGKEGVFVLRPVDAESVWEINGKEVRPRELGDYSLVCCLEQSGNRLLYREQGLSVLYVPRAAVPEPEEGVAIDMIGFVVYDGAVYTQTADYYGEDAEKLRGLLGEKLGSASGQIDEWSTSDEYAEEFASSVAGDVYTMRGYSPEFRLCVTNELRDTEGASLLWIQVVEHLNGIGVCTGAELFTQRLRVDGRVTGVRTQSFDDWNYARELYRALPQSPELDVFLTALNEGEFTDAHAEETDFSPNGVGRGFLYLDLEDGTTVCLYLYEGGWVAYAGMPWYPIRLPAEVFDPVFALCD